MALVDQYKDQLKDDLGRFRTASLFREQYNSNVDKTKYPPIFTLKDQDYERLISFKRVYLELMDPTGYLPAQELLGSWDHWKKLTSSEWFKEYLSVWDEELEVKMKSQALQQIREESLSGKGSSKASAAAYIAEKKWIPKRGRPSKEEVERERKIAAKTQAQFEDDAERLGLN